jgi:enoyl-CoA hydratase/carnithine racemase
VNEVVPGNRLMPAAQKLAEQLLATPPIALRETKRLIHADEGDRPKTNYLADTAAYIRCLETDDAREGIAAFTEKRSPNFRGR